MHSPICCWAFRFAINRTRILLSISTSACTLGTCKTTGSWLATSRSISGIRYEFATPPRERDMKWSNFDPATRAYVNAKDGSLRDQALIDPDWNNWAPRVGFSWSADSENSH